MTNPVRVLAADRVHRNVFIIALLITAAMVLIPIFAARFPPINDYPFHLARMVILARLDNPIFARFYELGSFLLPNVGMDAVVVPLAKILGPELATRVFVELTLLVMLFGTIALHWAAHRRLSVWPLLAVLFLHNGIFRFGFFNYLLGLGLALAAVALWLKMQEGLARTALAFIVCIVLIFCHMEAFGVFALIVGGIELRKAIGLWMKTRSWKAIVGLIHTAVPFILTLVLFVVFSPTASVVGTLFGYDPGWGTKPVGALFTLSSGILWLDAFSAISLTLVCAGLLLTRCLTFSRPLLPALAMLVLALAVLPSSLMGSLYADTRLGPAIALVAIASLGLKDNASKRAHWAVLATVLALACVRTAVLSSTWIRYDAEIGSIAAVLDKVEAGGTLFSVTSEPFVRLIADSPERIAAWSPPVKHIASYAVLHAPVFVPMTFADPTKQPLVVSRRYQPVKDFQGDNPAQAPDSKSLSAFIANLQDHLDRADWSEINSAYLLVMGRQRLEPMQLPASVSRVAEGDRYVLLRLSGRPVNHAQ